MSWSRQCLRWFQSTGCRENHQSRNTRLAPEQLIENHNLLLRIINCFNIDQVHRKSMQNKDLYPEIIQMKVKNSKLINYIGYGLLESLIYHIWHLIKKTKGASNTWSFKLQKIQLLYIKMGSCATAWGEVLQATRWRDETTKP